MTNKEAIEELKGLQEFINGTRLKGEIRAEVFDLAIKALEERPQGEWTFVQYGANPNIGNWHCSECHYIPHGIKSAEKNLIYEIAMTKTDIPSM